MAWGAEGCMVLTSPFWAGQQMSLLAGLLVSMYPIFVSIFGNFGREKKWVDFYEFVMEFFFVIKGKC